MRKEKIGMQVSEYRLRAKVEMKDFARKMNLSIEDATKLESGELNITEDMVLLITCVLRLTSTEYNILAKMVRGVT